MLFRGRPVEAVPGAFPLRFRGQFLDDDQACALQVAFVELGVEGASVGFCILRDEHHGFEGTLRGDVVVRDDVGGTEVNTCLVEHAAEIGVVLPFANPERGPWGVMLGEHARALEDFSRCDGSRVWGQTHLRGGDHAGAQDGGRVDGEIDDGGFDADVASAGVDDEGDADAE